MRMVWNMESLANSSQAAQLTADSQEPELTELAGLTAAIDNLASDFKNQAAVLVNNYRAAKRYPASYTPVPADKLDVTPHEVTPKAKAAPQVIKGPALGEQRPQPYTVELPPAPPLDEYKLRLSRQNKLTYLEQPRTDRNQCVGILYEGQIATSLKIMLDSGANINLMSEGTCKKLGIPVLPTSIRLTTSNQRTTETAGITPPVGIVYGVDTAQPLVVWHYFLVTRGMEQLYEVLIGNLDTQQYGGTTDSGAGTHTLRPQFQQIGMKSSTLTFPTQLLPAQA
jgi:hypothetical protein